MASPTNAISTTSVTAMKIIAEPLRSRRNANLDLVFMAVPLHPLDPSELVSPFTATAPELAPAADRRQQGGRVSAYSTRITLSALKGRLPREGKSLAIIT